MRPRLLDLFCGAGGAGMGYRRAGFDVVGIDRDPQPFYPFPFIQADALHPPVRLSDFDVIHASPPCQAYTTMNNRHGSESPPLLREVRAMLKASGKPYVIENVEGARSEMHNALRLTGEMFGLGVFRPRLFECSEFIMAPEAPPRQKNPMAVYGRLDGRRLWTRKDGSELRAPRTLAPAAAAMGMDWCDWDGLREAIPPAYTEWLGAQLLPLLRRRAA